MPSTPNSSRRPSSALRVAVLATLATFTLLYVVLLWHRVRLEGSREQMEVLKEQLDR